jgi:hypothetical protein
LADWRSGTSAYMIATYVAPGASPPYRGGAATKRPCEDAFLTAQW